MTRNRLFGQKWPVLSVNVATMIAVLTIVAAAQTPSTAVAFPYETVPGLYYFTDQALFKESAIAGGKPEFSESIHGPAPIDFDRQLAFTFDDVVFGPYLDRLLDILKNYHIKAVFFLTATHMGSTPHPVVAHYLQRMLSEGHTLGNHTWGHDTLDRGRFLKADTALAATKAEFTKLEELVDSILGRHYAMEYLRPPFGIRGNAGKTLGERMSLPGRVDAVCQEMGRKLILWHINSLDFLMAYNPADPHYLTSQQASAACLQRIRASRGGVVLFHANPRTPAMLEAVLRGLTAPESVLQGHYGFATVADLLEMKYGGIH